MAVLKPRNRLVYFRVSEDEFQQFVQLCEREGARSISDLARDAMHRLAQAGVVGNGANPQVTLLDKLIGEVSAQLQQLAILQEREISTPAAGNGDSKRADRPDMTEPNGRNHEPTKAIS